jgi:phytol kinase
MAKAYALSVRYVTAILRIVYKSHFEGLAIWYNTLMVPILIAIFVLSAELLLTQLLWQLNVLKGENARKAFHIASGVFVAFWPWFLSWQQIRLLGLLLALVILVIRSFKLFPGLYEINRRSWGELFIALSIIGFSFIGPSKIIFLAAALHVALADGLAAVIGVRYGKSTQYKILGYTKSIIGTLTFFGVSMLIMAAIFVFGAAQPHANIAALLIVPIIVTIVENIGTYGVDNALIAIAIIISFRLLNIG